MPDTTARLKILAGCKNCDRFSYERKRRKKDENVVSNWRAGENISQFIW